jgi:hypothetical protein
MHYFHYTSRPIQGLRDTVNQDGEPMKPRGLWLSAGSAWADWCDTHGFSTCNMNNCYVYECTINKDSLCVIDSVEALTAFQTKYLGSHHIRWDLVAADYDGIVFENYATVKAAMFKHMYEYLWFFGIDVDSVCLWNPSRAIELWSLTAMPKI